MPLAKLPHWLRLLIAVLPTFFAIYARPYLPAVFTTAPAALHYPAVLLGAWLGGIVPGLISTFICSGYSLFFIRPGLISDPFSDPPGLVRSIMFFSTSLFFVILIGAYQRTLAKAHSALAARSEFLSLASHELRTPLNVQKLQLYLLRSNKESLSNEIAESLDVLQRKTDEMESLLQRFTEIEILESRSLPLHLETIDLVHFIENLKRDFDRSAVAAGSKFELKAHSDLVGIWDRRHLTHIFSNILSNAIKYGSPKAIQIDISQSGDQAVVSIKDEGIGIPAHELKRIFKKFQRAVPYTHYNGLGLGLYIAEKSANLLNGSISVSSREGRGSTFTVALPIITSGPLLD